MWFSDNHGQPGYKAMVTRWFSDNHDLPGYKAMVTRWFSGNHDLPGYKAMVPGGSRTIMAYQDIKQWFQVVLGKSWPTSL